MPRALCDLGDTARNAPPSGGRTSRDPPEDPPSPLRLRITEMAEKANPKSQPKKGQATRQRRGQVAVPHARPAQEVTAPARPARDPGTGHRPLPPALAAPLTAPGRSRAPASGHRPRVPSGQDSPGMATATRGQAGDPGDSTEPAQCRVRVARLTEAGLRQLGGISRHQRTLEWLESTFASRAEVVAELQEELDGFWEFQEREKN
ncbi:translation initiation factor IF-2-like [Vidua chalybeata]|uniref:translation initiation factor IF-2-like n=1 Tax=Vidua chalybeata TaxID=81927 RepID=UPI0023A8D9E7|nr:translation initiation factor IF-2-like [Vidua chalybeata]